MEVADRRPEDVPPDPSYTLPLVTLPSLFASNFTSVSKTSPAIHHALDGIFESDRCAKLTVMQVLLRMGKLTGRCTYRLNIDSVLEHSGGYKQEGKPGDCSIKFRPPSSKRADRVQYARDCI